MPTYNHEKYISQAIESVLMQKTNFAWELLIHDDCSTDGTLRIAQHYADLRPQQIKLISETKNIGLMRSYKKLIDISSGSYLAILESDDVWLDENKLQIQADFLNVNDDYAIVATDIINIDENGEAIKEQDGEHNSHVRNTERWYEPLLGAKGVSGACNIIFRKSDFLEYCDIDEYIARGFVTFDYPTWLSLSFHKKCKYFPIVMAAYRIVPTSISHNADAEKHLQFYFSLIKKIDTFIISKYGLGSLPEKEYHNKTCRYIIGKALKFRNRTVFCEYAQKLIPMTFKEKLMHFAPNAYYWQFVLRHRKK